MLILWREKDQQMHLQMILQQQIKGKVSKKLTRKEISRDMEALLTNFMTTSVQAAKLDPTEI